MTWVPVALLILLASACSAPSPDASAGSVGSPAASESPSAAPTAARQPTPGELQLVGHDPLFHRGMNSALAVHGDFVYVGNRSDGSHEHGGVLVLDVSDPSAPRTVGEIGAPAAANPSESSRELRVWPGGEVLIVLNMSCHPYLHACGAGDAQTTFRFFDISGELARAPRLIATHEPHSSSHEFFLWVEPEDPSRALLYISIAAGIAVLDISEVRDGIVSEVTTWTVPERGDDVHSVSVSPDGRRAYVSALTDGVLVLDTSALSEAVSDPLIEEITSPSTRPEWGPPGAHSAVPVPGTSYLLTTDEVYGRAAGGPAATGCPWGWARLIDVEDEDAPTVLSEYRVEPWNTSCPDEPDDADIDRDRFASFSSHNPTVTTNLALITWHAAGLQVVGLDDPDAPRRLAEFVPDPIDEVAVEDPGLTSGTEKVAMWSYPIVRDGLIYVVDVRNGLYVLRYRGPLEDELAGMGFLEGNSNLGDVAGNARS